MSTDTSPRPVRLSDPIDIDRDHVLGAADAFSAAKVAIFCASAIAGVAGVVILWRRPAGEVAEVRG